MIMIIPRAADLGIISCRACGLLLAGASAPARRRRPQLVCPRCDETVQPRKTHSLGRAWAFLIGAAALYLPANLLVIMRTSQFPGLRRDTIMSGVLHLWELGSWDLALIVFIASIVVPLAKMIALTFLLITTERGSGWRCRERAKLFRLIEFVGYWSMLDVFVVALLTTLVQFGPFGNVEAGPALMPFGAVVVLTMLSALSFDPRLIWDRAPSSAASVSA